MRIRDKKQFNRHKDDVKKVTLDQSAKGAHNLLSTQSPTKLSFFWDGPIGNEVVEEMPVSNEDVMPDATNENNASTASPRDNGESGPEAEDVLVEAPETTKVPKALRGLFAYNKPGLKESDPNINLGPRRSTCINE